MAQLIKEINKYSIYLLFLFPILPFAVRSIILGIFGVSSLFFYVQNKPIIDLRKLVYFILPFVFIFISILYSDNQKSGLKMLEIMSANMIIPISFSLCSSQINNKLIENVKNIFLFSVFTFFIYILFKCGTNLNELTVDLSKEELRDYGLSLKTLTAEQINNVKTNRFRGFVISIFKTHTTYAGTYAIIAIYLLIEKLNKSNLLKKRLAFIMGCVFFLAMLLLFATRAPLALLVIGLIIISILKKRVKLGYWLIPIFVIASSVLVIPSLNSRVSEVVNNKLELPKKGNDVTSFNSINVRLGCYYCANQVFISSPLYGTGLGDLQDDLDKCYNEKIGASIYTWTKYNTHNQYLFFAGAGGVLALIAFLFFLLKSTIDSFIKKDYFLLYLSIIFMGLFMTENMLCRSDGIMTFCLFLGILSLGK